MGHEKASDALDAPAAEVESVEVLAGDDEDRAHVGQRVCCVLVPWGCDGADGIQVNVISGSGIGGSSSVL